MIPKYLGPRFISKFVGENFQKLPNLVALEEITERGQEEEEEEAVGHTELQTKV